MGVLGTPISFHDKFKFLVEIEGVQRAAFQRASELVAEVAEVNHSEGGTLIPNKTPGMATFPNVTLERGATDDLDLYNWFKQVLLAAANSGLPDLVYKRNLDIVQQRRDNVTLRRWSMFFVWPRRFKAGDWDNTANEKTMESVELVQDFFDLA